MNYTGNTTYRYEVDSYSIEFTSVPAEFSERACNAIIANDNPYFLEFLFQKITNEKYDIEKLEAGIIITVIFSALKLSGAIKDPVDIPNKIDEYRELQSNGLYNSIYSAIARVFPNYKLPELKAMTTNELIETLVFAEKVVSKEIFDTNKLRAAFTEAVAPKTQSTRKGVSAVSQEQIDLLKQLLNKEEMEGPRN